MALLKRPAGAEFFENVVGSHSAGLARPPPDVEAPGPLQADAGLVLRVCFWGGRLAFFPSPWTSA